MRTRPTVLAVLSAALLASCSGDAPAVFSGLPEVGSPLDQPQIVAGEDGSVYLAWNARDNGVVDIHLSRLDDDAFQPPVRVNDRPGSVNKLPIDEMRPAVATGPADRVAVVWTDAEFDIEAAFSADGGRTFGPAMRLNRDDGDALQEFPSAAFDSSGILHAVWLDPRFAEPGLEEPADLYYTTVSDAGESDPEVNLTGMQETSVCGCCLPDLDIESDGAITITFRNTTEDGYRDPFRIEGSAGQFGAPGRVSPPVWQIDACPVAGPIGVGEMTLWLDASTGSQRLLSAFDPGEEPETVLQDNDVDLLLLPPREVTGLPKDSPVVLVPMADHSRLIVPDGHSWRVIADDLPFWVTSAAVHDGQLMMVGTAQGFQFESRKFDYAR